MERATFAEDLLLECAGHIDEAVFVQSEVQVTAVVLEQQTRVLRSEIFAKKKLKKEKYIVISWLS